MDYNELDGNIGEENFAEEMPENGAGAMEHHHDTKGEKKKKIYRFINIVSLCIKTWEQSSDHFSDS